MKRILAIGDTHCGHLVGLTPPGWRIDKKKHEGISVSKRNKFAAIQRQLWDFYEHNVKKFGPYDGVMMNGDCIDGSGRRSGGTELITTDCDEQAEMAEKAIRVAMGSKTWLVMTYGTPYHVGECEDHENKIAKDLGAVKIGSHEWVEINGVMFDVKHEVSSSSVPHGRHTSLARANLWSVLWNVAGKAPRGKKSTVILRSHVHYHAFAGAPGWLAMTLPALQGMGTKYGGRRCEGLVDFGITVFEVDEKGNYTWHTELAEVSSQKAQAIRL